MEIVHSFRLIKDRPPRIRISARGAVRASRLQLATVEDISEAGLYVSCASPLPVGTELTVFFDMPTETGYERIWVRSTVRHRQKKHGSTGGMGLRFLRLEFDHAEMIRAFVRRHDPRTVQVELQLAA